MTQSNSQCWIRFATCLIAVSVIWGVVLPWVNRLESVRDWQLPLEEAGINPSAMFYTEVFSNTPQQQTQNQSQLSGD